MWVRPTNAGFVDLVQEVESRAFEYIGGALVFPFLCFANFLSGRGCHMSDAQNLARDVNMVEFIQGLVPGVGPLDFDMNIGMWHFIDVNATQNRFNDTRGLFYENAGPSFPGAADVAIMVAMDLAGLTFMPIAEGIDRYGRYDKNKRNAIQWTAHNVGHTEFSPVSNLAEYGWREFKGIDAAALGWPLHAIGDAAEPQHVTGTSAWGHRPVEDAVAQSHDVFFPRPDVRSTFVPVRDRVLEKAFKIVQGMNIANFSMANFALPTPRVCATSGVVSCECYAGQPSNPPLCNSDGTAQVRAKALPGLRELELVKALGAQAGVASVCADGAAPYNAFLLDFARRLDAHTR